MDKKYFFIRIVFFKPWVKYIGLLLMVCGIIGLYFFGYQSLKPDFLQLKVFSIYSQFLNSNIFSFINNNQGDELSAIIYFLGAFLWLTSAEKKERTFHAINRIKALSAGAIVYIIFFCIGYIFLHGMAVMMFVLVLPFFLPIIYFAFYYWYNLKYSA